MWKWIWKGERKGEREVKEREKVNMEGWKKGRKWIWKGEIEVKGYKCKGYSLYEASHQEAYIIMNGAMKTTQRRRDFIANCFSFCDCCNAQCDCLTVWSLDDDRCARVGRQSQVKARSKIAKMQNAKWKMYLNVTNVKLLSPPLFPYFLLVFWFFVTLSALFLLFLKEIKILL